MWQETAVCHVHQVLEVPGYSMCVYIERAGGGSWHWSRGNEKDSCFLVRPAQKPCLPIPPESHRATRLTRSISHIFSVNWRIKETLEHWLQTLQVAACFQRLCHRKECCQRERKWSGNQLVRILVCPLLVCIQASLATDWLESKQY